jgi:PAS domain S-box-containing protein
MGTEMSFSQFPLTSRVERWVRWILLIAVLASAGLLYSEWFTTQALNANIDRLQRAQQANEVVLSNVKDIETGQRGYLLTGNRSYLEPYKRAKDALPAALAALEIETQTPRTVLRALIDTKLKEIDSTIAIRNQQGPEAALAAVLSDQGKEAMDAVRQRSEEIRSDINRSLQEQLSASEQRAWRFRLAFLAVLCVLIGLVILSLKLIEWTNDRRERLVRDLAEERSRLEVLLTSIGDGVIVVDESKKVTFLNPVGSEITGWTSSAAVGQPLRAVFPIKDERDGSPMEDPVDKVHRDRKPVLMANHAVLTRKDGTLVPVDDSAAPIFDNNQNISGVVMIFRDVTNRRSINKALRQWEQIFIHAGFGMAVLSPGPEPRLQQVNPAFAAMHGYTVDELKGRNYEQVVAQEVWAAKLAFLSGNDDHLITEGIHVRKDGSKFPVLSEITLVRGLDGSATYAIGYWSDISDRKRAEEDLQLSEAKYRLTADSIPQLIWTATTDGTTEYLNNKWTEQTGLTLEQANGTWVYFVADEDKDLCSDQWRKALSSGNTFQADCRIRGKQGYRWHTCRAVPVRSKDGKIIRWFGSCTDTHEQRMGAEVLRQSKRTLENVNEALKHSNIDLEQFAYAASHDLQEPLRMVKIYSQLLQAEAHGQLDGTAEAYLKFIIDGADRMEALLRDLLAYSRATAEVVPAALTNADMVLQQALANLGSLITETEAQISANGLPSVPMPEVHLLQLFQNLISNAIKYRRDGAAPRVHIDSRRTNDTIVLSVADNGIGIPPQHQESIFRLFGRLHGHDVPGTGIGLALCKKLVERNGGRIWVTSNPDGGSTFYFSLDTRGQEQL